MSPPWDIGSSNDSRVFLRPMAVFMHVQIQCYQHLAVALPPCRSGLVSVQSPRNPFRAVSCRPLLAHPAQSSFSMSEQPWGTVVLVVGGHDLRRFAKNLTMARRTLTRDHGSIPKASPNAHRGAL